MFKLKTNENCLLSKIFLSLGVFFLLNIVLTENVLAYNPPIGIPDPGNTWEGDLHPIDTPVPDTAIKCPNWPSAESTSCYFIDNSDDNCTDSSNTYGYPDKPRCTLTYNVGTYSAGTYIEFHGEPTETMYLTFQCTAQEPCWVVGRDDDPPVFTGMKNDDYPGDGRIVLINSSYIFIDGLEFAHKHAGAVNIINSDDGETNNVSVRNCYIHDYEYIYDSSTIDVSARDYGKVHDVTIYNNHWERLENNTDEADPDLHGSVFTVYTDDNGEHSAEAYNLYWLSNEVNDGCGSGIQVNGGLNSQSYLHHIYLGRNTGGNNRQRLIGIKQCSHVVISQNDYTTAGSDGSGGVNEPFGWALSPDYVWYIFNKAYDSSDGWRSSDSSGGTSADTHIYIIGNEIYNIKPKDDMDPHNPDSEWRYGQGVHLQNGSADVYIVDNTFYNCYGGVLAHLSDNPTHIYGNIFYNIFPGDTFISYQNLAGDEMEGRQSDYNLFFDPDGDQQWRWKSNNYTTLADWRSITGHDIHSQLADPQFINGPSYDFRLKSTSPAKDANKSPRDVYDLFQSLYGVDIRVDFNGVQRPQGADWDMGAYEYVNVIRANVDQNSSINSTDAMLTIRNSLGLDMLNTNWQSSTLKF